MIQRLRVRFILLAMSTLLIVLVILVGGINIASYRGIVSEADRMLSSANSGRGFKNENPESKEKSGLFSRFSPDSHYNARFFSAVLSSDGTLLELQLPAAAVIDPTDAAALAEKVFAKDADAGFQSIYRYYRQSDGDAVRIRFLDCGRELSSFQRFLMTSLLLSAVGLLLILGVVIYFSKRIVRPFAESYEKQKQFITDAGHEIKTPLTIIQADADVLEMELGENEWLADIQSNVRRLTDLTNDLVSLARMEEGGIPMEMVEIPLSDVVTETAQSFHTLAQAQKKDLHIAVEPMLSVEADEKAVSKLVRILLDNALKYSPEPLDSPEVMSLFQNTKALGITPDDIGGCKLGALGIPEFGTDFAMQMLIDTKPQHFSDLVRIAGLSHGTDVWLGNAQTLIQEGKATISTAICTRDDIMIYLIGMGMDSELSFTIMESVRKGKGLKPEWEEAMTAAGVPDWYIWSCKKIKYMFPKAHAAAYVMMAWRIAYCKVFYPLAYYSSFFSIRAKAFSYEVMCMGRDKLEVHLADFKKRIDNLSNKEEGMLRDMRIVQEMYARGFEFMPIDLFKADALRFQIIDGKIMPSLNAIDGLGENAAVAIKEAAKNGEFLSKDDFRIRTKATQTQIELLDRLGILGNLPDSNQLSLFDL